MALLLVLFKIVLCAARYNVFLVVDVVIEGILETDELRLELAGSVRNQCEHVCAACFLQ